MKSSSDSADPSEQSWVSNRVHTAKYTPLTFIPKNLFEQFRNVANLYFLFLVILQCIPTFGVTSPVLSAMPLVAILTITGIKDAFEDWKRNQSDERLNISKTLTLSHWTNVNIPDLTTGRWHRLKIIWGMFAMLAGYENEYTNAYRQARTGHDAGSTTAVPTCVSFQRKQQLEYTQSQQLRSYPNISVQKPVDTPDNTTNGDTPQENGTPANLTPQNKRLLSTMRTRSGSFRAEISNIFKPKAHTPYRPGMIPHNVLHRTATHETGAQSSHRLSMDVSSMYAADQQIGHEPLTPDCRVKWKETLWQDVKAGDYVLLKNDEPVPADVIILSSSEPDGICYVETKNLDGETNLKMRKSLQATGEIYSVHDCERASFYIESEPPHANLYQYNGVLRWQVSNDNDSDDFATGVSHQKTEAVTYNNILLRGCVLRNTKWLIAMVMFCGNETKIMLNTGKTPSKRSKMAKGTNPHVVANFGLLAILCIVSSVVNSIQYRQSGSSPYFGYGTDGYSAAFSGFLTFWVTLILYQNIIPISLYISVEIVKTVAAYFIFADIDMYNEETDQPCIPKTWNISDDLGQIEYIFSDKTGTLTQNVMEYRRCTINGVAYGLGSTEAEEGAKKREQHDANAVPDPMTDDKKLSDDDDEDDDDDSSPDLEKAYNTMHKKQAELFDNKFLGPNPSFVDPKLFDDLAANNQQSNAIVHFFSSLALCHTVIVERPDPENENYLDYKAQSPDEAALVATARDLGFAFIGREKDTITLNVMGERKEFELLNVLEFNSTRKRMSVIVRAQDSDRIILLCKGADSVIYEHLETDFKDQPDLEKSQKGLQEATTRDLEEFANQGLRTLCLAFRFISEEEYAEWHKEYQEAANSISNREEKLEEACEEIEHSLILLGGTAIEDRLQDGVPDTIAELSHAGIKIWVLTGDKTETAINIGFACNLLTNDMMLIVIKATTRDSTNEQLREAIEKMETADHENGAQKRALVIDGATLKYALENHSKDLLLELGTRCASVVCCRVSPMQKAQVVSMVKKGLNVMTLAIGDGANDVSMIQAANVGVGISGVEGRQAVMASDYAIAQFRFLKKLVLVHGRWSYLRTANMIFTFFYKNIVWTFVLFWYQLFCQFSGTMMFDYSLVTLYNLVFTSLPCIFFGIWDQDLDAIRSLKYPELYLMGLRNDVFKTWRFWLTVIDAIYQSVICFFLPYLLLIGGSVDPAGKDINGVFELGTIVSGISVFVVNLFVGLTLHAWTWLQVAVITVSTLFYFLWVAIYSQFNVFTFAGQVDLFGLGYFWLVLIVTIVACFLPRVAAMHYMHQYRPYDNEIIREIELLPSKRGNRRVSSASEDPNMMRTLNSHGESVSRLISRATRRTTTEYASDDSSSDEDTAHSGGGARLRRPSTRTSLTTPPRAMITRHHRQPSLTSIKSDRILYLQSGKRASFTGFAFSADDSSPYDTIRQSVYRRNSHAAASQPNLPHQDMELVNVKPGEPRPRRDSSTPDDDWISLNFAPLSRSESAPAPNSETARSGVAGKSKMSNVMNNPDEEAKTRQSIREFVTRRLSSPRSSLRPNEMYPNTAQVMSDQPDAYR
ncbi:hypothetical protein BC943DRAFT_338398 [Umbelopsis sp. AD052]|nr:hypothetical protein BC943DRAFT_338398 [Umbelopsis sp. AD052]